MWLEDIVPNGIMEGRQQGEASLCVHSKSSMKAEADWGSLVPVEQEAKKGLNHILGHDSRYHKEGCYNIMWEDRSISRTRGSLKHFFLFSCLLMSLMDNCNKPKLETLNH